MPYGKLLGLGGDQFAGEGSLDEGERPLDPEDGHEGAEARPLALTQMGYSVGTCR